MKNQLFEKHTNSVIKMELTEYIDFIKLRSVQLLFLDFSIRYKYETYERYKDNCDVDFGSFFCSEIGIWQSEELR